MRPATSLLLFALADAVSAPYVVVRKDGTVVRLVSAPREKGPSYVGTLWPEGPLVTFRRAEVDETRTAEANRLPASTPAEPIPTAVATPRPTPVSLKVSRAEAEKRLQATSGTARAEDLPERAEPGTKRRSGSRAEGADYVYTDFDGHGEAYWRKRAQAVHERLARARAAVERADAELERVERSVPPGGTAMQTWAREVQRLRGRAEDARVRVDEARAAEAELEDEARRARALPGWLR